MGVSILSGFFTTFGSGSALFTCDFLFFKKFGMTISITVLFAFFISNFVFGAFMHTVGPQQDTRACCRRKNREAQVKPMNQQESE